MNPIAELSAFPSAPDLFYPSHDPYFVAHMRSNRDSVSSAESSQSAYQLHHSDPAPFASPLQPTLATFAPISSPAHLVDDVSTRPQRSSFSNEHEPTQLFACPYTKYDAQRYSAFNLQELNYRGCGQCYLTDISRLKQHLYRVHERPQHYCPMCYMVFKGQDKRDRHITSRSCTKQPCPFDEKMTTEQLAVIKKKNRGMNPTDCWYDIYQTLFGGAAPPASPFASFSNTSTSPSLDQFMQYVQDKAPTLLRQQLCGSMVLSESVHGQVLMSLETTLGSILRELRRDYEQTAQIDVSVPPSNASAGHSYEDDEHLQRLPQKRKRTDSSLQVPTGFRYSIDAQSLGSYGDASAPNSFRSTPALGDDEVEGYGRRPVASPANRFAVSLAEHRDPMHDLLPDQLIRVASTTSPWQPALQAPSEKNAYYQNDNQRQTTSPATMIFPDPGDWHTNMMTGLNLTMGMSRPGYTVSAPAPWAESGGNHTW